MQQKVKTRISPALNACKAFSGQRSLGQRSTQLDKKVHFDLATVSFQVNYNTPDDNSLKKKIPVWTEHWNGSKTNLLMSFFSQISLKNWFKISVIFICFFAFLLNFVQIFPQFFSFDSKTLSFEFRENDSHFFPKISVCFPIIFPFFDCNSTENCLKQKTILVQLNSSQSSFGIKCKIRTKSEEKLCFSEKYFVKNDKKCLLFSKDSKRDVINDWQHIELKLSSTQSSLTDGKNPEISIFSGDELLPQKESDFYPLKLGVNYEFSYRLTRFQDFSRPKSACIDNNDEMGEELEEKNCFSKCLMILSKDLCNNACLARDLLVRPELLFSEDTFCARPTDCPTVDSMERKCEQKCSENCFKDLFDFSVKEFKNSLKTENIFAETETEVKIENKHKKVLVLNQRPLFSCFQLLGILGGILFFWIFVAFLFIKIINFFSIFREFLEIYFF